MLYNNKIWVGTGAQPACLLGSMANRHGLIAGATGTGKTVSLKVLAEGFSAMGVPVFLADVKGDLSGMVCPGEHSDAIAQRLAKCGVTSFNYQAFPTVFWDVYGEQGHPVRATVSEMGPLLLSRMLGLNETQTGVMNVLFRVADDEGMLLLDIKDLKAMLAYLGEHARDYTLQYGNVSVASIGAIQRAVAVLEDQGGNVFFGEPALDIVDWMQLDEEGRGNINVLAADKLFRNPTMYSTFLLWMLTELYELLPEVGDMEKPRMVFFFDEAHLLFSNCPKSLLEKVEQVVRLIRSKGVGVYFISQNPSDIPMSILGQLGNRIQHALRAYTPLDQKAVKVAAQTFRVNPAFDTETAITNLAKGEALVSFLDAAGVPCVVDQAIILPPQSSLGAIDSETRRSFIESSPLYGVYDEPVDRESAYELLVSSFTTPKTAPAAVPPMPTMPVYQGVAMMQPAVPAAPAVPDVPQYAATKPQGFMVFDPATGKYIQKELPQMSHNPNNQPQAPVMVPQQQPVQQPVMMPQQPVMMPQQPMVAQPVQMPVVQGTAPQMVMPQVQQMAVMVYDPASGQYVQQIMTMQLDPTTGNYIPVQQPQVAAPVDPKELEKQQKAAEKAAKEAEAAARRQRADELREERAERARKNDSVMGRMKNTAISTVSREVTRSVTRNLMGSISNMFGGKKK